MMSEMVERLRRSRARFRRSLLLAGTVRSATAAMALFVGLEGYRRLALATGARPHLEADDVLLLAFAALLAFLSVAAFRAWRMTPTLLGMAQLGDARFGLQERVTTAYETLLRGAETPVQEALLADAASHSRVIEPAVLVPISAPRPVWPSVALLGAVVALLLLPQPAEFAPADRTASTPAEEGSQPELGEKTEETGAKVRRVAELVGRDAEARRNPYLQAVARSFDDLGRRIEAGELGQDEIDDEVGRLLQHLEQALGGDGSAASAGLLGSSDAGGGIPPSGEDGPAGGAGEPGSEAAGADAVGEQESSDGERSDSRDGAQDTPADLDELLNRLQARLEPRQPEAPPTPRSRSGEDDAAGGFYTDVNPDLIAEIEERQNRLAQQRAENRAGGEPVGAAEESNEGPGDLAGEGAQPLGNGTDDQPEAASERFDPLELPERRQADGRRIRIEIPADAEFTEVDALPEAGSGGWRRSREGTSAGTLLGMIDRDVVSRYFIPHEEDRDGAPR